MSSSSPLTQTIQILVVDDDPDTREALSDLLEHEGYRVHAVGSGEEAIRQVRQTPYSAALLDMQLPDLHGLSVMNFLMQLDPKLPIIVLTAYAVQEHTVGSLQKGAFAYLTKPYNSEEVKATIGRAISVRALAVKAERVEGALTESEDRFRAVVESAPDAIIVADHAGAIISWNKGAQRLFAYAEEEVLGQALTLIMPARYRDAHQKGIERIRSAGAPRLIGRTIELHGLRKDGSEFPLELSLATWKTAKGTFYSGILRDITERKRAEASLRESQERFRQLAENICEVFWLTDPRKNEIIYISPGYEAIWGRPCESLYASPRSWLDAIHPADQARVLEAALTKQVTGEYDEEYCIVRPDGTIRWVHDRAFPIRDESGRAYRIAGIAEDITERKQAQQALRNAYDRIETILASLPGAIVIVGDDRKIVYANSLAWQFFGSGQPTLISRPVSEVLPLTESRWDQLIETHTRPTTDDEARQPGDELEVGKRVFRYRLFSVALRGSEHQQTGLVLWDVTEHKVLQDQLIQAEKLASLGTLVTGMAHEINNPMQSILGLAQIILEETDAGAIKEYARDIAQCAQHVAAIVRNFTDYARPTSRDEEVEIDLGERLSEAVKMAQRCPQFGHAEVVTTFQPTPHLRAKRSEIDQVFVNLISNAVEAMDGHGRLTLATETQGTRLTVRISDTGCGISKPLLGKIFDPFFTTKEPGKGTGLGLSIVHKIVTKYGGTISAESEEGKGTTFTVTFPTVNR